MRFVLTVFTILTLAGCPSPKPLPSTRPADFTLDVRVRGGIGGIDDVIELRGDRLSLGLHRQLHEIQLSKSELDEIYEEAAAISRVHERAHRRNDIADAYQASMVVFGGGVRYEVSEDRETSDVIGLWSLLGGIAGRHASQSVDLPAVRADDFSLTLVVSGFRGNSRAFWKARLDPRRSYLTPMNLPESELHPTSDELDLLYATCRTLAASTATLGEQAPDEDDYRLEILAGGRQRVFYGTLGSVSPEIRSTFTGLRSTLDAMVPAKGPPWPEATPVDFRIELFVAKSEGEGPYERYQFLNGRLNGNSEGRILQAGELDAIYARARDLANKPAQPAPVDRGERDAIHVKMSAAGSDRTLDSSRHELGADLAALRQQLEATLLAR